MTDRQSDHLDLAVAGCNEIVEISVDLRGGPLRASDDERQRVSGAVRAEHVELAIRDDGFGELSQRPSLEGPVVCLEELSTSDRLDVRCRVANRPEHPYQASDCQRPEVAPSALSNARSHSRF